MPLVQLLRKLRNVFNPPTDARAGSRSRAAQHALYGGYARTVARAGPGLPAAKWRATPTWRRADLGERRGRAGGCCGALPCRRVDAESSPGRPRAGGRRGGARRDLAGFSRRSAPDSPADPAEVRTPLALGASWIRSLFALAQSRPSKRPETPSFRIDAPSGGSVPSENAVIWRTRPRRKCREGQTAERIALKVRKDACSAPNRSSKQC